jgi:hypothetical protein
MSLTRFVERVAYRIVRTSCAVWATARVARTDREGLQVSVQRVSRRAARRLPGRAAARVYSPGDVTFTFNRNGTVVVQWGFYTKAERNEYLFGEAKERGRYNFCKGEERGGFHSPEKDIVRLFMTSHDTRILMYKMQASDGGEDSLILHSDRRNQLPKEPLVLKRVKLTPDTK